MAVKPSTDTTQRGTQRNHRQGGGRGHLDHEGRPPGPGQRVPRRERPGADPRDEGGEKGSEEKDYDKRVPSVNSIPPLIKKIAPTTQPHTFYQRTPAEGS